jgi:beta-mannanase
MFWSPNQASSSDIQPWWPDESTVDIVGIDVYPHSPNFQQAYGDFYNAFAKKYNKPFAIGETGAGSGDVSAKEKWVSALANADVQSYPCFVGFSWFEYYKGGEDFRIIEGQSSDTVRQTLSNFQ